jgi:NADPH-dependent glutamate synthase beta subunit-like oxidoreductase
MKGRRVKREDFVIAACAQACPAGVDVPRYLRCISEGNFDESLAVVREKIPFPTVCADACFSPCEDSCAYKQFGDPIAIRDLKRAAVDRGSDLWKRNKKVVPKTGKRIAVVGAGPAGLTAAYYLVRMAHEVTVFNTFSKPGGTMRYGITNYDGQLVREVKRACPKDSEVHFFGQCGELPKISDLLELFQSLLDGKPISAIKWQREAW